MIKISSCSQESSFLIEPTWKLKWKQVLPSHIQTRFPKYQKSKFLTRITYRNLLAFIQKYAFNNLRTCATFTHFNNLQVWLIIIGKNPHFLIPLKKQNSSYVQELSDSEEYGLAKHDMTLLSHSSILHSSCHFAQESWVSFKFTFNDSGTS